MVSLPENNQCFIDNFLKKAPSLNYYWFSIGPVALGISTYAPLKTEELDLFKRFLGVFELAYTRYHDIEKAEAQTKESQIQLALEKVRARTMAMQKSEELGDAASIMFDQLKALGFKLWATTVDIWKPGEAIAIEYAAGPDGKFREPFRSPINYEDPIVKNAIEKWNSGTELIEIVYSGDALIEANKKFSSQPETRKIAQSFIREGYKFPDFQVNHFAVFSHGFLQFITVERYAGEHEIFVRFAKVFEQTYTRFLDLQKAEAQTKESQIQLALERVRARTMAMQRSDELSDAVYVLFQQFKELGENPDQATIGIINEEEHVIEYWVTMYGNHLNRVFKFSIDEPHVTNRIYNAWKEGKKSLVIDLIGKELNEFTKYREKMGGAKHNPKEKRRVINVGFFSKGLLNVQSLEARSEESVMLLERFALVLEQTYTRFLDLQKAEAQAREAQIEAALERVRARTMAMHNSKDVGAAIATLFFELDKLGVENLRCGIANIHEDKTMGVWSVTNLADLKTAKAAGIFDMNAHILWQHMFKMWHEKNELFHYCLTGQEKEDYIKVLNATSNYLPQQIIEFPDMHFQSYYFNEGAIWTFSLEQHSEADIQLMKRFTSVFSLTFRRYQDLKKAEAQAREAQIEAALERVRSRTLAMQKSDELAETAAVLFKQLISLGIEPNRLYISIMKDDEGDSEFWITDEDGTKVSSAYTDNLNTNTSLKKMLEGWKSGKQSLIIDMQGDELRKYFQHLTSLGVPFKGGLKQKRRIQHLAYFNRGFIGMAAPDDQPDETIHLLERFAAVFNLTFTRFNDLKIAEAHALQAEQDLEEIKAAKKKAEDALTELQATQKQLVQSEKMASLGELTAGIAHEIQNPLNFVNNFSEVSNELIEEMNEELLKGDVEEARAIAEDIKQNLEKINHHGKRADAIVKGMLQHSRTSSGQKELTDINLLCDEYLRLAYHGLRAKDKTFNAKFESDFDSTIEKINVIPQDVGRVVLNLINNAFYAVTQKSNEQKNNYQPAVTIKTKKIESRIYIEIIDNGNGIPPAIKEKIFQPFFTTKPTGQGTGLGLSLSYDIIKAHDGEIKVESREGQGSEFKIMLPA